MTVLKFCSLSWCAGLSARAELLVCICVHSETCGCERISRADHLQAFILTEAVSHVSKHRNCIAHLSVHDGVQCLRWAELLKVRIVKGELQSSMGQEMLSMLTLMSTEHELLCSLDFTDTIQEFAHANARKWAIWWQVTQLLRQPGDWSRVYSGTTQLNSTRRRVELRRRVAMNTLRRNSTRRRVVPLWTPSTMLRNADEASAVVADALSAVLDISELYDAIAPLFTQTANQREVGQSRGRCLFYDCC